MSIWKNFICEVCNGEDESCTECPPPFEPKYPKDTSEKEEDSVPMSRKSLFDNASAWLDDEPWRTW